MQKGTIVKISSILQSQKIPEGIQIRLENHFSPTGDNKTLIQRNPLEIKKMREENFRLFYEDLR